MLRDDGRAILWGWEPTDAAPTLAARGDRLPDLWGDRGAVAPAWRNATQILRLPNAAVDLSDHDAAPLHRMRHRAQPLQHRFPLRPMLARKGPTPSSRLGTRLYGSQEAPINDEEPHLAASSSTSWCRENYFIWVMAAVLSVWESHVWRLRRVLHGVGRTTSSGP